jgi:Flp pilus assembly pilin Flp
MKSGHRSYIDVLASVARGFASDSRAIAALEYALIASMIAVAIAVAATTVNVDLSNVIDLNKLNNALHNGANQVRDFVRP